MDTYKQKPLTGTWVVTIKLDGVQVVVRNGVATSRTGKPLYNLPELRDGTYECFVNNCGESVSACRTHNSAPIGLENLFKLEPEIASDLVIATLDDPTPESIEQLFQMVRAKGFEGLVLRGPNGERLKVKATETHDVIVRKVLPGTGKHAGRMGSLLTDMGKVGTGFSDEQRQWFGDNFFFLNRQNHTAYCDIFQNAESLTCTCDRSGFVIEVKSMELTANGKFRHPRFIRVREDKRVEPT